MPTIVTKRRRLGNRDFGAAIDTPGSDDLVRGGIDEVGGLSGQQDGGGESIVADDGTRYNLRRPLTNADTGSSVPQPGYSRNASGDDAALTAQSRVQVAPRRKSATSGPKDELARLQAEEQQMTGQTRIGKRGQTLYGRDAVQDKNGRLKTGGHALLDGLGLIGPQGNSKYDWGDLSAQLGHALGLMLGGFINKKYDEQQTYDRDLGRNRANQKVAMAQVKFDTDTASTEAATTGKQIDNVNSLIKPYLDTVVKSDQITEDQAKVLSGITGLPFDAADWRKRIRKDKNGITYVGTETSPGMAPDTSLPITQGDVEKNRSVGDQEFVLSDNKAAPLAVGLENAAATRAMAAASLNSGIAGKNAESDQSYSEDTEKRNARAGEISGKIAANKQLAKSLEEINAELDAQANRLDPKDDKSEISSLRSKIAENKKQYATILAENVALDAESKTLAKPVKKQKLAPVKVNPRRGRYSDAEIENVIRH
jgi:hypothetical protein